MLKLTSRVLFSPYLSQCGLVYRWFERMNKHINTEGGFMEHWASQHAGQSFTKVLDMKFLTPTTHYLCFISVPWKETHKLP